MYWSRCYWYVVTSEIYEIIAMSIHNLNLGMKMFIKLKIMYIKYFLPQLKIEPYLVVIKT